MYYWTRLGEIDEKTLGPGNPKFATTLASLAGVYRDTGRYADAERLYEQVRAIQEAAGVRPEQRWLRDAREGLASLPDPGQP